MGGEGTGCSLRRGC